LLAPLTLALTEEGKDNEQDGSTTLGLGWDNVILNQHHRHQQIPGTNILLQGKKLGFLGMACFLGVNFFDGKSKKEKKWWN
jgi:hypothetical protein